MTFGQHLDLSEDISRSLRMRSAQVDPLRVSGRLTRILGTVLHASLADARIGEEVILRDPTTLREVFASVIGFSGAEVILAPASGTEGLSIRTEVIGTGQLPLAPSGPQLLGRVIDAFGRPLDNGPAISPDVPLESEPPAPLSRPIIDTAFVTGLRAIDGMLTLGVGQRVGIFGAAGVGKSTLLSQIIRNAQADCVVLGLIGERGREVAEFLERDLGEEGRQRACVIVATSDRPATERLRAAYAATAAAEEFRRAGKHCLLLMDSATRGARAMREIGLSAGEPPVRRGYPPSTFALLPRLMERPGCSASGAITALYTVLVEGDDDDADPVADEVRSLLDGHIILSRPLAQKGHFPSIDVLRSKSRVMDAVISEKHRLIAREVSGHLSKLQDVELLLQVGEYKPGGDRQADAAIQARAKIDAFLQQGSYEKSDFDQTYDALLALGDQE